MQPADIQILELLKGCGLNNRNSQQQLYNLLKDFAMRICYRYLSNNEEAEEAMNEGFVKLFIHLYKFDAFRHAHVEAALKGWFKKIMVNTCIDHLRKSASFLNGHTLTDKHEQVADSAINGLDVMAHKEIIECIKDLSPAYRTVFNLFVIEGFSHEEISGKLNITIGASKSNLSKAKENLRKIIIKKLYPELNVAYV